MRFPTCFAVLFLSSCAGRPISSPASQGGNSETESKVRAADEPAGTNTDKPSADGPRSAAQDETGSDSGATVTVDQKKTALPEGFVVVADGGVLPEVLLAFPLARLQGRDAVVAMEHHFHEGEPTDSRLWLLDATSGRVFVQVAVSATFTPDETNLVFGVDHVIAEADLSEDELEKSKGAAAKELGVTAAELDDVSFTDGLIGKHHVVQTFVYEMVSGSVRVAPGPGGGTLGVQGGQVIELPLPGYDQFPHWKKSPEHPVRVLDASRLEWSVLSRAQQKTARQHLKDHPYLEERCLLPSGTPTPGAVLLTTRDKSLALVVLDESGDFAAVRLPRGWNGTAACPCRAAQSNHWQPSPVNGSSAQLAAEEARRSPPAERL